MAKLAVNGGTPVREGKSFPRWPIYGEAEKEALMRVLADENWGINSVEIDAFEKEFAAYQQCRYAVTMCNGSTTLRNAILACGVESGDEVIVPPYTFLATVTGVLEANCVPVFADIDPETFNLDPAAIERAITPRTKVIIPVHIGGNPAEMDSIMAVARKHGLKVIEDAAHAVGAEYKGRRVGSIGDIGSFSFQSSKNLCCGEGGAIVTNDEDLFIRCWSVHNCGRDLTGAWYEHNRLGGNYRLGAFAAALLRAQMKKLEGEIALRDRNARRLIEKLSDVPGVNPLKVPETTTRHAWHLFVMRYDKTAFDGLDRAVWLKALQAEGLPLFAGYDTPHYRHKFMLNKNFYSFDGWRKSNPDLDYGKIHLPCAEKAAYEQSCWLPQNVMLGSDRDIDDVADAFRKVYENRSELK